MGYTFKTPLDGRVLESFYEGDLRYALKMFEICLEQLPAEVAALEDSERKKDIEESRKILHKIKPTFTMVGNDPLSNHCTVVEKSIASGVVTFEDVKEDILSIIEEIRETLLLLGEESDNLKQHLNQ